MEINIITKEDDRIKKAFKQIEQINKQIETVTKSNRSPFNSERYYTDVELSAKLSISRRTLQVYRTRGIIGYLNIGGKTLYRESEIEKLLQKNYYPSFKD